MNHYYTNNSNLESKERIITYSYRSKPLSFISDIGVFSKDRIDFGTHTLLNSLPDFSNKKSLLDVGCGIGIIGISLGKAYQNLRCTMIDVNDRAILLCEKNTKNNEIKAEVFISNLYENVKENYDVIISNPPIRAGKKIVWGVADGAKDHLNKDGELYIVIQKKQGAESMMHHMEEVFGNVQVINKEKGYFILKSKNM